MKNMLDRIVHVQLQEYFGGYLQQGGDPRPTQLHLQTLLLGMQIYFHFT